MVAGRLEIRVVSSPVPPSKTKDTPYDVLNNLTTSHRTTKETVTSNRAALDKFEADYVPKGDRNIDDAALPSVLGNGVAANASTPPAKALKSILKNKSDSSLGERALKVDTRLSLHQGGSGGDDNANNDTPDIVVSTAGDWPPSKISLAESCDFHTAKTHDFGYENFQLRTYLYQHSLHHYMSSSRLPKEYNPEDMSMYFDATAAIPPTNLDAESDEDQPPPVPMDLGNDHCL